MENGPQIRTIGSASDAEKEKAKEELKQLLFSHLESMKPDEREQMEKYEYPKSATELACIDFANKETNELMKEAGVEPYDIPAENYHIVPPELFNVVDGNAGNTALTFTTKQGIIFNAKHFRGNPVAFGNTTIHETLHLKAHLSIEVGKKKDDKVDTTHYRRGVSINSLQKHEDVGSWHRHFRGLNEAIIATQEKKSIAKLLELPELSNEKQWLLSNKAQEMKKELSQKKEISEDDIIWIGEKGKDDWNTISYTKQRQVLDYVCREIQKQFSEQYQSTDEVFKEFLKSHFTGQLLVIARLVEKTFGEGNFRILGNMGTERNDAILHLESFKKARMRQVRSKE